MTVLDTFQDSKTATTGSGPAESPRPQEIEGIQRSAKTYQCMAAWAERKADEAAASGEPRWLGNVRIYQNMASKFWGEHYRALRAEESSPMECSVANCPTEPVCHAYAPKGY